MRRFAAFLLLVFLAACGVQGDLYLPDNKTPGTQPVNEKVQDGDDDVNAPL